MSDFRVRPGEPVAQELARIIAGQLERARDWLADDEAAPEVAFHEARRRVKKARAAARVARTIDKDLARDINAKARDAARLLSEARDADVVAASARALAETTEDAAVATALGRFADSAAKAARAAVDRETVGDRASRKLAAAAKLAAKLEDCDAPSKAMKRAAARAAERAAEAFDKAHEKTNPANAPEEVRHEWRKQVKEMSYVERLLVDVWPLDRAPQPELTKDLGKLLGEERDLLLLTAALKTASRACGGVAARDAALAFVQSRRNGIVERTTAMGRALHEPESADA